MLSVAVMERVQC